MNIYDVKPFVISDFLTQDEYDSIYKTINSAIDKNVAEGKDPYDAPFKKLVTNGFVVYFDDFEKSVLDKFKKGLEAAVGHPIHKPGILFCRYTKKSGDHPRLLPHADRAMKNPAITTTLELNTSLDWDIYIEHDKFNLNKNDILIFSGSHHTHWRPHTEFNDDDYFDIIICQSSLEKSDDEVLNEEFFAKMDRQSGQYVQQYLPMIKESLGERKGMQ
jgi:hypothetical protein